MDAPRESTFDEMKRYVRFDESDAANLRTFGEIARPHFDRIAALFYERTREHEDAHAVFTGEEQIARLHRSLVAWMERLCTGPHDAEYFREREKIGRMHVKIGLPQRYMFTGMALIRAEFERIADQLPIERALASRISLARILDLELAIMLETYREDYSARIHRIERLERDRLERALARSEHRYANAVEAAHLLIVGIDPAGRIALINRETERVTGYGADEALGRGFVEFFAATGGVLDDARVRAIAAGAPNRVERWEMPVRTKSGNERMIEWQLAAIPRSPDEEIVLFAIGRDMTDERELRERTLRTEKLAAVGTLAAGLAHEIRNPLNGALLHVTFLERALRRSPMDEETLSAVTFVGDEIRRLSALVKDFLVFARPAPPQFALHSIREICTRAFSVVEPEAAHANVKLTTDYPVTELMVPLDAQKLEQVLLNLLRNAIDAVASAGGGNVLLRARRVPRHAILEVEDDGPGIPDPDAPIFDAFYSTKPNGTGLGLAIVHRVVTDHGGKVEFESRPGRTVFRVVLPIQDAPLEAT